MDDGYFRRVKNFISSVPYALAQVRILKIVKELFVKAAQTVQQIAPRENEASRQPSDGPLLVALPPHINARMKPVAEVSKDPDGPQGHEPFRAYARQRTYTRLKRAIGIQDTTSEGACLWMAVRISDYLIEGSVMDDRVRI